MNTFFLVLILVWLLALSLLVAGLVRHLGTLQAVGSANLQAPAGGFLYDTDGPWIPSELPGRVLSAFTAYGIQTHDMTVTFFSSGCGSCIERATNVAKAVEDPDRNVFLITGAHAETSRELRSILAPSGAPMLTDPEAHDIVKTMEINSTPFAFRVIDGQVVSKAYLRTVDDYRTVASTSVTLA